ncbi:hairy-related 12 [Electrophorus electricus]|uniref:Transcription factor HES-5 n=1 Tax=Electrophorus electricus TaxID=8005 RepID=A0A4W4EXM1_ELEEL|nr:hairy-related 12 [Electrophorus electricus]
MAPHTATLSTFDHLRFSDKDKLKMRKPIIEKMRRDRINSSIDQLKKLLEKEVRSQNSSAKLEKADVLEMTVSFLKQWQGLPAALVSRDYDEGYSRCWRESLQFHNVHSSRGQSTQELQQCHQPQPSSTVLCCSLPPPSSKRCPATQPQPGSHLWRPW